MDSFCFPEEISIVHVTGILTEDVGENLSRREAPRPAARANPTEFKPVANVHHMMEPSDVVDLPGVHTPLRLSGRHDPATTSDFHLGKM
jgi:hypothetical protein